MAFKQEKLRLKRGRSLALVARLCAVTFFTSVDIEHFMLYPFILKLEISDERLDISVFSSSESSI